MIAWIDTKLTPPRKGVPVLVYYPNWIGDEIQVGILDEDGLTFDICSEFNFPVYYVPYWMPLPKPPKGEVK